MSAPTRLRTTWSRRVQGRAQIIGLCIERSVDLVAGLLGIFKSGAAYVPLDPNYPSDRLE